MSWVCVGNDVVDLDNPRTQGRSRDERFLARVFDETERAVVLASSDPDLELWCHWAAKEAGFKVISKLEGGPPPFVHRRFRVTWRTVTNTVGALPEVGGDAAAAPVIRRGVVHWQDREVKASVSLHRGCVHALAHASRSPDNASVNVRPWVELLDAPGKTWAASLEELLPRFSAREADAVYSPSSAAVRLGARGALAELLALPERRLEIVCAPGPTSQRPPRVLLDGGETDADVSLSHDGRLIAWAIWVGRPTDSPAEDTTR